MSVHISYSDLIFLNNPVQVKIEKLMEFGAEAVEILMDGPEWSTPPESFSGLVEILKRYPLEYSIHPAVWDTNLASENRAVRELSLDLYRQSILFAGALQARQVVIHPGFRNHPVFNRSLARRRALEAVGELSRLARPLGVRLAVENVGEGAGSLYSEDEFACCLDDLDDSVGYLIDVGHAFLNRWNVPALIDRTRDRLFALHLHDNRGAFDDHFAIGDGVIEWEPVWEALGKTNLTSLLVLEFDAGINPERMRECQAMLRKRLGGA